MCRNYSNENSKPINSRASSVLHIINVTQQPQYFVSVQIQMSEQQNKMPIYTCVYLNDERLHTD
jgi:hypothetical protein